MNKKFTIIYLLSLLFFQQLSSAEYFKYIFNQATQTPQRALITSAVLIGTVGTYNIVKNRQIQKEAERKRILAFNEETLKNFKINKDTIIAFDLHGVVANYNITKMLLKSIQNVWAISAVCYPKIFPAIYKSIKSGASAQQILEQIEKAYPNSKLIKKMCVLGIDLSAQLIPIQETINIAQRLMQTNRVIFLSNIEPMLWERFVADFPMFKNCCKFLPCPENNYLKKPDLEYFNQALKYFNIEKNENGFANMLFIDDKIKFTAPATRAGIPSYVFTCPSDLVSALASMQAIV